MSELQEIFEKVVDEKLFSPANTLYEIVLYKLEKQGIRLTAKLKKDLREQIDLFADGNQRTIEISDNELIKANPRLPADYKCNVQLTDRDFDRYVGRLNKKIEKAYPKMIDAVSDKVYKIVKRNRSVEIATINKEREAFEKRLNQFWRVPIERLEYLIDTAQRIGADVNLEQRPLAAKENDLVFEVLTRLHARACKTAHEVLVLIKAGFADGAHARWRTLHEISVISNFIAQHGNDVAERYLLHQHVVSLKAAKQNNEFNKRLGVRRVPAKELKAQESIVTKLKARFGPEFANDYGWAAGALASSNPRFSNLEEAVGYDHWRPYYKMASYSVHAGPKGVYFSLGLKGNEEIMLAGASNAGFTDPAQGTAISLHQITGALILLKPNVDSLIWVQVLQRLAEDVGTAFFEKQNRQDEIDARLKRTGDSN
jgi:hypothetical protein